MSFTLGADQTSYLYLYMVVLWVLQFHTPSLSEFCQMTILLNTNIQKEETVLADSSGTWRLLFHLPPLV